MLRIILTTVAVGIVARAIHLVYLEIRNADHVWHHPCITPQATRDDLLTMIRGFARVADAHGVRWWLDYGTLLGAWRLGTIMPYDHDADLSYLADDRPLLMECKEELAQLGLELNFERNIMLYRGVRMMDVEAWEHHGPLLVREHPSTREGLLKILRPMTDDFPEEWVTPRWRIELDGEWYPCPNHPERLLLHRYPTCRIHLRLCFPHKQKCWFSADFWREAWRTWNERRWPRLRRPDPDGSFLGD